MLAASVGEAGDCTTAVAKGCTDGTFHQGHVQRGLKGMQPPSAPKYLPFSDRELRFEKNRTSLALILTEIGFFKYITSLLEIMQ